MMNTRIWNITLHFYCFVLVWIISTEAFEYLGCYNDATTEFTTSLKYSGGVKLSECAQECRKKGVAFMATHGGDTCQCGKTYGASAKVDPASEATSCNYTCREEPVKSCGGVGHFSVYYTVDTSAAIEKVAQKVDSTFDDARKKCIQEHNGDVFSPATQELVQELSGFVTSQGISDEKVWIGLRKRGTGLEWTDKSVSPQYDETSFASFWVTPATAATACVALKVSDNKWVTESCTSTLKYICKSTPEVQTNPVAPKVDDTGDEEGSNNMAITFYVVIPIFVICYGGSCLIYVIAKLRRACKRKQKKKLMLTKIDAVQEFEPDNKPKAYVPPPPSKRAIFTVSKPSTGTRPPPYRPQQSSTGPTTPRDITPEIRQTRVDEAVRRIRTEMRRRNLLQNALQEARDRRKATGKTPTPDNPDDAPVEKKKKKKKDKKQDDMTVVDELNNNPPEQNEDGKKKKRKKKNKRGDASADDDTPVLAPEQDADGKNMTIGEIVQMKTLMREKQPKKPKRILAS